MDTVRSLHIVSYADGRKLFTLGTTRTTQMKLDNKEVQTVVDYSTLASLFVGFVGVLIGVIAVVMWN